MFRSFRAAILAGAALFGLTGGAGAATLIGLTAEGSLVRIDTETRRASAPVRVTGANGTLLGIDVRPRDGALYGVTSANQIVRIDPASGAATQVSVLNRPFESGGRAVVDFNPVADRLRLMGVGGMNYRINVDTGEVAADGQLKYQPDTPLAATAPRITAGAYTNSVQGATATMLLNFDSSLGNFTLQAPPNDGVQQVRGQVGMALPPGAAFDILSDGTNNTGYVLAGGVLHTVNLQTGALTAVGPVTGAGVADIIDIAAMR